MQVEVQSPNHSPTMDNFEVSGFMSSPYLSAPSSPKRFGEYYLSAPTSPSRLKEFYQEFDYFPSSSTIPFEAPTNNVDEDEDGDENGFAFLVSHESDKSSRSAEELFHGGKIKPLKPEGGELVTPHKTPLVSQNQNKKVQALLPKEKNKTHSSDPFGSGNEERRGRDRTPTSLLSSSNSGRRASRSHSPYRISHYTWEEEQHTQQQQLRSNKEESATSSMSSSSSKSSKRWRLRDLLLFRSASEGSNKDPLRKDYVTNKNKHEDVKSSSFRSSESAHGGSKRKGNASAHELHYAMKKAESQDLKKRTFLPYRQGILGRLAGLGF